MQNRNFIGSSDIAIILGLNPYSTILKLWAEKTGQLPPEQQENEATEWGKRLERVISKKFSEEHKVKLIAYKKRFYHTIYKFLSCELDNIISKSEEIVEIKTASLWKAKEWESAEEIPAMYIAQVMWQMGLSNRKKAWIAILIGGQKYLEKEILFNHNIFKKMVTKAVYFWQEFVLKNQMPIQITKDDSDILYKLYPNAIEGEPIQLGDETNRLIETLQANKADLMTLKDIIAKNENELKASLRDNAFAETNKFKISWKEQISRRLNLDKFKEEQQEIYNRYCQENKFRVLRYTEKKGEGNG
jgi:putative phage-type endonuclease